MPSFPDMRVFSLRAIFGVTVLLAVAAARLEAEPSPGERFPVLQVESNVELATVYVDDRVVGLTPWADRVAPGPHHLVVAKDGYRPFTQDIEITVGKKLDVTAVLEK